MMSDVKNAAKIKLLALDVDGVLTDGSLKTSARKANCLKPSTRATVWA